jgi:putative ABC transport system ATP-binding protein
MALIQTNSLTKTYKEKTGVATEALRGVDLTINQGDFVAIAGPSGSGKTTLLNILGALDNPSSGDLLFEGEQLNAIAVSKLAGLRLKKIGFVFQAYNLFNPLTALENVEYVMLLQGISKSQRKEKAAELLKSVGLENFMHKRPNQLSGGQQQRVAVVRALASNPKVILADEPTANLDSDTAGQLIDLMRQLNQQYKTTFVFSTHDKMVMDKADKVFLLKDGKIVS